MFGASVGWAALALVALVAEPALSATFTGDDSHWRAVPATVDAVTAPLTGAFCQPGATGRVLSADDQIEIFFSGTQIQLYGIPPPADVVLNYMMDLDEVPPPPTAHTDPPPPGSCQLMRTWSGLQNKLHNLTIVVQQPSLVRPIQFIIANATVPDEAIPSETQGSDIDTLQPSDVPSSDSASSSATSTNPAPGSETGSGTELSNTTGVTTEKKHTGIIAVAAVLGLFVFFGVGFGLYALIRRRKAHTPPSAEFKARMANFVMVTGENGSRSTTPAPMAGPTAV